MENLGYNTHNSIIILGSLGLMAFCSISMMFFFMVAIIPIRHFIGYRYRKLRKTLFFGQIIKLTHGGYFEVLVATYLNLRFPINTLSGETAAFRVAQGYMVISLVLFPLLWCYTLKKSVRRINTRQFQSRFGALFENIKKQSKWTMIYYLIFIVRRCVFCLIAFFVKSPLIQIQLIMYSNLIMIIYQGQIKPFITKS